METKEQEAVEVSADTDATVLALKPRKRTRPARKPRSWRDREIAVTKRRVRAAGLAALLLLGGIGSACGYFAYEKHTAAADVAAAQARQTDRDAAAKAASTFLTTMFTVNDGSLDRWDSAVLAATTDSMHDQLAQWRAVLEKLVKAHVQMSSVITDIGPVSQNGDAVTLLAVIESTGNTDPNSAQPGTTDSSAVVDMRRIDGTWKVQGYGPAGGMPAAKSAPAPTSTAAPAPDQAPR
ncbi:hypothetical protein ACFXHA_11530 [Nocardia sp. NPDC059240]|uniref:hypothetical protein n=1 Tax=Nocardia sp. NPDC059240 TaxID=3346786 RepID=UPI0036B79837